MKKIFIYTALAAAITLSGCTQWLNDTPNITKVTQPDLYSTELGIYSVLNGLYTDLTDSDLYGKKLSMGSIEMLARYYDFAAESLNSGKNTDAMQLLTFTSQWNYETQEEMVRKNLAGIWDEAYKVILGINTFIEEVSNSEVISEEHKAIALGEAYGLRALLHMDVYRLYGPVSPDNVETLLPYNNIPGINIVGNLTAREYLACLMDDIDKALSYLDKDPIRERARILDQPYDDELMTLEEKNYKMYRNFRMNYYAVTLLKVRTLLLQEKFDAVDAVANVIINEAIDHEYSDPKKLKNNAFAFTPSDNHMYDYLFYDEVIFGPFNFDRNETWRNTFMTGTLFNDLLVSDSNLSENISGLAGKGDLGQSDRRRKQWEVGAASGQKGDAEEYAHYVSSKFSSKVNYGAYTYTADDARNMLVNNSANMQVLMRISEVYYAKAEANLRSASENLPAAIANINKVLLHRGFQASNDSYSTQAQLPLSATKEQVEEMLWREYYREFFMEGQTFFYLKRNNRAETVKGNGVGVVKIESKNYVVPKPKSEVDYF